MCETLQALKEELTDVDNESTNTESREVYEAAEPALSTMPVEVTTFSILSTFFLYNLEKKNIYVQYL